MRFLNVETLHLSEKARDLLRPRRENTDICSNCQTMLSKLVILISGSGTNLQAIIDAITSGTIPNATICLVISNRKNAFGLERARLSNIKTLYLNLVPYGKEYPNLDPTVKYGPAAREAYDADLAEKVLDVQPDMVIMAGFMHVCSTEPAATPLRGI